MPKNMKYDQVSSKAGSGKKKGPAESKELSEDGPVIDQADKGSGRKKGGAKHHGNMPPKKGSGDHKDGHKGGAKHHGNMPKKGSGDHKEGHKGSAQVGYDAVIKHGKDLKKKRDKATQERLNNNFNAGILDSINLEHSGKGDEAKKTYGKNYGQFSGEGDSKKYIGDEGYVKPSAEAVKSYMDFKLPGASRGYTQNFGPARQNSYAKGAAKVAQIMGKGAAEFGGKKGDDSKSKKDYEG
jgi:hypothetical protein